MTQSLRNPDPNDLPGQETPRLPDPLARILRDAVDQGASDIHLDTWGNRAAVRYRVDGVAREMEPLDLDESRRMLNQIKVAARLDLQATLRPLEGQFRWRDGQNVRDVRVTIIPEAPRNEAAHLRLLTRPDPRCTMHSFLTAFAPNSAS